MKKIDVVVKIKETSSLVDLCSINFLSGGSWLYLKQLYPDNSEHEL